MKKKELTIQEKALLAMEEAVEKVKEEHKKLNLPIYIWKDGRVQKVWVE